MTAMNLIVQADAGAAYLLTDSAQYLPTGEVWGFASKVIAVALTGGSHAAIATAGRPANREWTERLRAARIATAADLLSNLPGIIRQVASDVLGDSHPTRAGENTVAAVLALYNGEAAKVQGFGISNNSVAFPQGPANPPYRPWMLQPMKLSLTGFAGHPIAHGVDPCRGKSWCVEVNAGALIEAQRADKFGSEPNEFIGVGGQAVLTKVTTAGIEQSVVKAWGDSKGRRIGRDDPSSIRSRVMAALHRWQPMPMPVVASGLSNSGPSQSHP